MSNIVSKGNSLPVIPEEQAPIIGTPYSSEPMAVCDGYIATAQGDSIKLAPITTQQQRMLRQPVRTPEGKENKALIGTIVGSMGSLMLTSGDVMSYAAGMGTASGLMAIAAGLIAKHEGTNFVRRRRIRKVTQELQKQEGIELPDRKIDFRLPRDFMGTDVIFPSEMGMSTKTVGAFHETAQRFPGFHFHADSDNVQGGINPWTMTREVLNLFDDPQQRSEALVRIMPALEEISDATHRLPKNGLDIDSPESMRRAHANDMTRLALGGFTIFGTIRAQYGPILAERAKGFYASRETEYAEVLEDAQRLTTPTEHNVPWTTMEGFKKTLT